MQIHAFHTQLPGQRSRYLALLGLTLMWATLLGSLTASAQVFDSGSDRSDGALNLMNPGPDPLTIIFDPSALGLDPDGDNIYHFASITIGARVTVRLSATYINGPVFWLASGPVQIDGTIDLSGEDGHPESETIMSRHVSVPGVGGYAGGLGGNSRDTVALPPLPGSGPGGEHLCVPNTNCQSHGRNTSNSFLVPLVGGSGGAGMDASDTVANIGAGGGAGGGAILIASSMSITVDGSIIARGGRGGTRLGGSRGLPGEGAGGSIRLAAPVIGGTGLLSVSTDPNVNLPQFGFIRLEAFQRAFAGNVHGGSIYFASPFAVFPNPASPVPSVRVVSVAGAPVPPTPTGRVAMPDVTINQPAAVTLQIEAQNIPPGTVVKLHLLSEADNGTGKIVDSTPLAGTLELSTATASVVIPPGFSQGFVRATWTP